MDKKIRPLLKWTGGKFDEFALFSVHIPDFDRYIEPFFGGGGVFFALQPKVASLVNDKSSDLINFYKQIANKEFKKEILLYADAWDDIGTLTSFLWDKYASKFIQYMSDEADIFSMEEGLSNYFMQNALWNNSDFILDFDLFKSILLASIADKAKRIKKISAAERRIFSLAELYDHFETGLRSGVYLFFRKILNAHYLGKIELNSAKAAANWYFVREFCYASMFRFNTKGEFNIPYGGIAYNKKKFREKIERIFKKQVTNLFKNVKLSIGDFESFLINAKLTKGDFIFVDPPYDSEFSEYDQSAFTQKDQERLAIFLKATPAKWMVVIKETPLIRTLYTCLGISILTFNKKYAYNVRGRNNRGVTHLIIKNY